VTHTIHQQARSGSVGTGNGDDLATDGRRHVNGEAWIPAATQVISAISPRATARHTWHSQDGEYYQPLTNGAPPGNFYSMQIVIVSRTGSYCSYTHDSHPTHSCASCNACKLLPEGGRVHRALQAAWLPATAACCRRTCRGRRQRGAPIAGAAACLCHPLGHR
jgi:hypothetical protein